MAEAAEQMQPDAQLKGPPPAETKPNPMVVLRDQLLARMGEFKNALPAHMPPERFVRVVLTAVQLNPELLTVNRQSFWNACMRAANDGLLPDGRQGVILPFYDNNSRSPTYKQQIAQWLPMIAGLLVRFRNSGQFKAVSAEIVREGEEFQHWVDENGEHLRHVPGDEDGKPLKAYAMAITKDGGVMIKVMSVAQIEKRRAISKAKDGPLWGQWWDEAALKTVLRNLHKRLPSSSDDLDRLMQRDAEIYGFEPAALPSERREQVTEVMGVMSALDQFGGEPKPPDDKSADESVKPDDAAPTTRPAEAESEEDKTRRWDAYDKGRQARERGVKRSGIPQEYRDPARSKEAVAWHRGWNQEAFE